MKGVLGLLLISVGLVGAYLVLSGKFPPGSPPASGSPGAIDNTANYPDIVSTPAPVTQSPGGGLLIPHGNRRTGNGGISIWTQLGHLTALSPNDSYASRGIL